MTYTMNVIEGQIQLQSDGSVLGPEQTLNQSINKLALSVARYIYTQAIDIDMIMITFTVLLDGQVFRGNSATDLNSGKNGTYTCMLTCMHMSALIRRGIGGNLRTGAGRALQYIDIYQNASICTCPCYYYSCSCVFMFIRCLSSKGLQCAQPWLCSAS